MLLALLPLALVPTSLSRLVNVTIDDTYGDERTGVVPVYALGSWLRYPDSDDDSAGLFQFGPLSHNEWLEAYNQTLHCMPWLIPETDQGELDDSALLESKASITFNGTAVYFYIARKAGSTTMEMTFYLDGALVPAALYRFSPGPYSTGIDSPEYISDQLAFTADQLPPGEHRLDFVLDGPDADSCFDYAIYTMDDGTPSGLDSPEDPPRNITTYLPGSSDLGVSATGATSLATPSAATGTSHAGPPHGLLIVAPLVGGVIAVIACAWFYARWRQRSLRAQLEKSTGPRVKDSEKSKEALGKGTTSM